MFSNGKTRPVWPPTEEYAYCMLMLHKPGVHEFADIKGQHETYLEAFHDFLSHGRPHVPDGLARDLTRAYMNYLFREPDKSPSRYKILHFNAVLLQLTFRIHIPPTFADKVNVTVPVTASNQELTLLMIPPTMTLTKACGVL